jgi:large subunit ribosomal protein L20
MPRVKRGVIHSKRRRNILKQAKGFKWGRKKLIRQAKTAITKAGAHAYVGRKKKKSEFRQLWQVRLSAAVKPYGLSYSKLIDALKKKSIVLNRKMLSTLAADHPQEFKEVMKVVKSK